MRKWVLDIVALYCCLAMALEYGPRGKEAMFQIIDVSCLFGENRLV